jgi:hypothetical protein
MEIISAGLLTHRLVLNFQTPKIIFVALIPTPSLETV